MDGLGPYIKYHRERLGLSVTALAERADLTKSQISAIENGRISLPGADKRRALAAALNVRHIDLIVAAGELTPDEIPGGVPAPDHSPAGRIYSLLQTIDLDVDRRERVLRRIIRGWQDEDRSDGRIVDLVGIFDAREGED